MSVASILEMAELLNWDASLHVSERPADEVAGAYCRSLALVNPPHHLISMVTAAGALPHKYGYRIEGGNREPRQPSGACGGPA